MPGVEAEHVCSEVKLTFARVGLCALGTTTQGINEQPWVMIIATACVSQVSCKYAFRNDAGFQPVNGGAEKAATRAVPLDALDFLHD